MARGGVGDVVAVSGVCVPGSLSRLGSVEKGDKEGMVEEGEAEEGMARRLCGLYRCGR